MRPHARPARAHRRRHQSADGRRRRQSGVRRWRARFLPVSHDWPVRRGLFGSGRAVGRRAFRVSRRAVRLCRRARSAAGVLPDSLDWIPVLHDRGYDFFKLGEEAHVSLDERHARGPCRQDVSADPAPRPSATACGSAMLAPGDVADQLDELRAISADWLQIKGAGRTAVLDRVLRRRLHAPVSVRRRRGNVGAASDPRVREPARRAATARNCRST